jgi:hypothetical protein
MDYVDQSHRDGCYRKFGFSSASYLVTGWMASWVSAGPAGGSRSVSELSRFSGRYRTFPSSLGYSVDGYLG